MLQKQHKTTIDNSEIQKFSKLSKEWWDENGKFRILHIINPIRLSYIRDHIIKHFNIKKPLKPLTGLKVLDVGCGGGLVSVPLYKMGAEITGIDATNDNIEVAKNHAKQNDFAIKYLTASAEKLVSSRKTFDVVIALEIIEHVADKDYFLASIAKLLKPGGVFFLSTINRNLKSLLLGKIAAEYILSWVPRETHEWSKFVKPDEITKALKDLGLNVADIKGINYKPFLNKWHLSSNTDINYILCARK